MGKRKLKNQASDQPRRSTRISSKKKEILHETEEKNANKKIIIEATEKQQDQESENGIEILSSESSGNESEETAQALNTSHKKSWYNKILSDDDEESCEVCCGDDNSSENNFLTPKRKKKSNRISSDDDSVEKLDVSSSDDAEDSQVSLEVEERVPSRVSKRLWLKNCREEMCHLHKTDNGSLIRIDGKGSRDSNHKTSRRTSLRLKAETKKMTNIKSPCKGDIRNDCCRSSSDDNYAACSTSTSDTDSDYFEDTLKTVTPKQKSRRDSKKDDNFRTPSKNGKKTPFLFSDDEPNDGDSKKHKRRSRRLKANSDKRGSMRRPDRKKVLEEISPISSKIVFAKRATPRKRVSNFIKERSSYNCDRNETFLSEDELSDFINDEIDEVTESEESDEDQEDDKKKKKPKPQKIRKQKKIISSSEEDGDKSGCSEDGRSVGAKQFDSSCKDDDDDVDEYLMNDKEATCVASNKLTTTRNKEGSKCKNDSGTNNDTNQIKTKKIPKRYNKQKENTLRRLAQLKERRCLAKLPLDKRKSLLQTLDDENDSEYSTGSYDIENVRDIEMRDSDIDFVVSEGSDDDDDDDSSPSGNNVDAFFTKLSSSEISVSENDDEDDIKQSLKIRKRKFKSKRVIVISDSDEEVDKEVFYFFESIKKGLSIEWLKSSIESNHDLLNSFDRDGKGLLHAAAAVGNVPFIEFLLSQNLSANTLDRNNMLAVGYSAYYKQPEALLVLLKKTKLQRMQKIVQRYSGGMTLMHLIILTRKMKRFADVVDQQLECLRIIKKFDLKMHDQMLRVYDDQKRSPLMLAIEEGNSKCTEELFMLGTNGKHLSGSNKENLLHYAVAHASNCTEKDSAACLHVLLQSPYLDIDATDQVGFTPLMYAAEMGNVDCINALCEAEADVNCEDNQGTSPLHLAAATGSTDCVKKLISYGHPVDCLDNYGWPPLLYANFRSSESCVVALMESNPEQLFILSDLIKCEDPEQREKNMKVVRSTLMSLSNQDAYYKIFNDFIRNNPDLLETYNHGVFLKTWRNILDFNNKYTWFKKKIMNSRKEVWHGNRLVVDREKVLECAMKSLESSGSIDLSVLDVTFENENGICLGPKKEFLECFCRDVVRPERNLFQIADDRQFSLAPLNFFAHIIFKEVDDKMEEEIEFKSPSTMQLTDEKDVTVNTTQVRPSPPSRNQNCAPQNDEQTPVAINQQESSSVGEDNLDDNEFTTNKLLEINQSQNVIADQQESSRVGEVILDESESSIKAEMLEGEISLPNQQNTFAVQDVVSEGNNLSSNVPRDIQHEEIVANEFAFPNKQNVCTVEDVIIDANDFSTDELREIRQADNFENGNVSANFQELFRGDVVVLEDNDFSSDELREIQKAETSESKNTLFSQQEPSRVEDVILDGNDFSTNELREILQPETLGDEVVFSNQYNSSKVENVILEGNDFSTNEMREINEVEHFENGSLSGDQQEIFRAVDVNLEGCDFISNELKEIQQAGMVENGGVSSNQQELSRVDNVILDENDFSPSEIREIQRAGDVEIQRAVASQQELSRVEDMILDGNDFNTNELREMQQVEISDRGNEFLNQQEMSKKDLILDENDFNSNDLGDIQQAEIDENEITFSNGQNLCTIEGVISDKNDFSTNELEETQEAENVENGTVSNNLLQLSREEDIILDENDFSAIDLSEMQQAEHLQNESASNQLELSRATDGLNDFNTNELREIRQAEILEGESDFSVSELTEIGEASQREVKKEVITIQEKAKKELEALADEIEMELGARLEEINFVGRFIAACIVHGYYINFHLTQSLIKEILNMPLDHPNDLKSLDFELYNGNVSWVLENSVDGLEFPFSISCKNIWHPTRIEEIPLAADPDVLVTDENKVDYVKMVSKFKLQISRKEEIRLFKSGFYQEINPEFIGMFTPDEFSLVMNGVQKIDVVDWKKNTQYIELSPESDVVVWFWRTVERLKEEEKALLLKFSTGSPCVPVGGFKDLEGLHGKTNFTITRGSNGRNKIPTSSTCFNRIYIGEFDSEKELREKVLVALRHGSEGFEFC